MMNTSSSQRFMKINQAVLEKKYCWTEQNKERRRVVRDRNNALGPYDQMHKKPLCVLICASLSTITQKPIFSYFKHNKSRKLKIFNIWKMYCVVSPLQVSHQDIVNNETKQPIQEAVDIRLYCTTYYTRLLMWLKCTLSVVCTTLSSSYFIAFAISYNKKIDLGTMIKVGLSKLLHCRNCLISDWVEQ